MTATTFAPKCPPPHAAPLPPQLSWWQRLAIHLSAPSIDELDAATLKDIGASEEARAQAELRQAYRHWFSPSRLHGF
jgi:hypothetical protein